MKAKTLRRRQRKSAVHEVCATIDARKAAMGKPKLLADIQREAAAKTSAAKAKSNPTRKTRPPMSSKNDITTRGWRLKGSGWSGPNQK